MKRNPVCPFPSGDVDAVERECAARVGDPDRVVPTFRPDRETLECECVECGFDRGLDPEDARVATQLNTRPGSVDCQPLSQLDRRLQRDLLIDQDGIEQNRRAVWIGTRLENGIPESAGTAIPAVRHFKGDDLGPSGSALERDTIRPNGEQHEGERKQERPNDC
ncbi:MAG TPA: hypothetical protein QGF05_11665 [Dehalococcoidia bacterium]|nr:hypothetical protein [Dehalococcoidia bacterium]